MLLHPLIIPITYLSKCGQALWAMVDSGRLEVHMDAGDMCTLPARLPQHLLGVFDVVDTTNVGDYLTPLAVLSAMGTLVKPGEAGLLGHRGAQGGAGARRCWASRGTGFTYPCTLTQSLTPVSTRTADNTLQATCA